MIVGRNATSKKKKKKKEEEEENSVFIFEILYFITF